MQSDLIIELVVEEDLSRWSKLWCTQWEGDENVRRSHEITYYKYRFLDNSFNTAFKCIYKSKVVGFCGVKSTKVISDSTAYIINEYCDVIFDPNYRQKGISKRFFQKLIMKSDNVDVFFMYPINREAFISWRFLLDFEATSSIHRWVLSLPDKIDHIPKSNYEIKEESCDEIIDPYLKWRYVDHPEKHGRWLIKNSRNELGRLFFKIIENTLDKTIEISSIELSDELSNNQLNELIQSLIDHSTQAKFNHLIIKVLKGSKVDRFISSIKMNKTLDKLYVLQINKNKINTSNHLDSKIIIGEDLDVPRSYNFKK